MIIVAVKDKYPLPQLLKCLGLPKSSCYQEKVTKRPDKYRALRIHIKRIFEENRNCYGYNHIYGKLKKIGMTGSEKIVRSIMKE